MSSTVKFSDDFSVYPTGPVPYDYSPWGEYHCKPEIGRLGVWREVTTRYSWITSRGNWRVSEDGGKPVMEQTFKTDISYPMIIAHTERITSGSVSAGLRRISAAGPAGIVFGYVHSRNFCAFLFENSEAALIRRVHDSVEVCGSVRFAVNADQYCRLRAEWDSSGLRAYVNDEEILNIEDCTVPEGRAGLTANVPARFAGFSVQGNGAKGQDVPSGKKVEGYPAPLLWKKIDISDFGTDRNIRVGDLNGDGENELVLAQGRSYLGSGDFCHINCLTAVDLDGNVLWQNGAVSPQNQITADLCFQVHDLDGDGAAEVVFTKDFALAVADGTTGEITRSVPTPAAGPPEKAGSFPMAHIIGDALHFCDMQGSGRDDTIILKDRYNTVWAYSSALEQLWSYECRTGHYPAHYDIDGDGRDELMSGYTLLSPEGVKIWELEAEDHADSIVIGDFGQQGEGPRIAVAGSDAGFFLLDADGSIQAHYPIGHAQSISALKLREDVDGLQLMVNTYWSAPGITVIFDSRGRILKEFEPVHYASLLNPVNWTYNGTELVLLSADPDEGGLLNGYGERVIRLPDDGHPVLCCDAKDLDNDGIDEIMVWDYNSLWIYKPDPVPDRPADRYPERNPLYNDSNYRGHYSFPRGAV